MSAIEAILILSLVAVIIGMAASAARFGVALSSDPQDLSYWFRAQDEDLDRGIDPDI
jgi:hypothetical protein